MSDNQNNQTSDADAELEREIRKGRKFTLEEAIGRLAGPGAMKGVSAVAARQQAEFEIESWLKSHLPQTDGTLVAVLQRHIRASEILQNNHDQPLIALAGCLQRVLGSDFLLSELVRAIDIEWGRVMDERPRFENENSPPHPDDLYTIESVRKVLTDLFRQLAADAPRG